MARRAIDTPMRRWRVSRGLTQEEAAERVGMTQRIWARYEVAERIARPANLSKLMQLTGLPYEAFLYPASYLETHPTFLREGMRPLQGRGWPIGVPRTGTKR